MTTASLKNLPLRRKGDQKKSLQLRSLQLLNGYRLIIAALMFSFNLIELTLVRSVEPSQVFLFLSSFYILYSLLALLISSKKII